MTLFHRMEREDGMTLLEVFAVMAILGILAALSYAVFMGQDRAALDVEAKSNARSLLGEIQGCYVTLEDYRLCDEPTEQGPPPGVVWGAGPGEAEVLVDQTTAGSVTVRAVSRARTGDRHHTFTIVKEHDTGDVRTCESSASNNAGGCDNGTW